MRTSSAGGNAVAATSNAPVRFLMITHAILYFGEDFSADPWPAATDCTSRRKSDAAIPTYLLARGHERRDPSRDSG